MGLNVNVPAPGYHLRRVKKWGQDAGMVRAGYSTTARLVNGREVGQFCMVEPYGVKADGTWVGTWSAISNYSTLTHDDLMCIAAWQKPETGNDVNQKMNYLYHEQDSHETVAELWGIGKWNETSKAYYGHMVHAGQWVAVSDVLENVRAYMPNESAKLWVQMRELLLFRRADFSKSFSTHPWLVQRATAAYPTDRYGEFVRGEVFMSVMLDPRDFPANNRVVRALLPVEWLE